jgi:hypothetical protein
MCDQRLDDRRWQDPGQPRAPFLAAGRLNRWSAVCGEAVDGGMGVVGGGQAVAAGGLGPGMSHELGDQDEVVAVAETGAEGVAQYVAAEAGIEAGFGGDGQQDVVGAAGRQVSKKPVSPAATSMIVLVRPGSHR